MTVAELALAGGILGVVFLVSAGAIRHVRDEAKQKQTRRLLWALDEAIGRYHATHGAYPDGTGDFSTEQCLAALRQEKAIWGSLGEVSPLLVAEPAEGGPHFHDGWRTPLRYLTARGGRKARERVAINGGRPIFESAGPDRDFGDGKPVALPDNIATDYLGLK